jgi:hypothetical protein
MKHKDKIDGTIIEMDDGDKSTDDITELHGKLAEEADDELVASAIKILKDRGYIIISPRYWGEGVK